MNKKRVVFCTYPSLYSSLVLKNLLADDAIEVVGIIRSTRVLNPKYNAMVAHLKQIKLTGWRYSTYLFFVTDVFAVLSFFSANKKLKTISSTAKQQGIPVYDTVDINLPEAVDFIINKQVDVLLAAHFNQLIKAPVFDINNLKFLNIHPSLLPAYKGVDPVFYALLNGEDKVGVSVHEMKETFDTGDIHAQKGFACTGYNSVFSHNCQLFETGAELAIDVIKEGMNKGHKQDEGNYDSWPNVKLVKALKKKSYSLISLRDFFKKIFSA